LRSTADSSWQKRTPAKSGSSGEVGMQVRSNRGDQVALQPLGRSETGIGQVAVADGDASACHQQSVDSGHEAAEHCGGRREAKGGGLGHSGSHLRHSGSLHLRLIRNLGIPDTSANPVVCMAAFLILQCNIMPGKQGEAAFEPKQKGRPKPAAPHISRSKMDTYSAATLRGGSSAPES
jgi:hypothetical protein